MFPMIADIGEFDAARAVFDLELDRAEARGERAPGQDRGRHHARGAGADLAAAALLSRVDFISVGTNDLMQFLFAADRGNPRLADRYDALSPPVLQLLSEVARACDTAKVPVAVCGEMAGQPLEAMALIGVGFRTLSMAPASIGPVKAMVRSLELAPLEALLAGLATLPPRTLRSKLHDFARDHAVAV